MNNLTYLIGALLIIMGCQSANQRENGYKSESGYTKSTQDTEVDCYQLKEETLAYLKDNWDDIKDILQRESERSENEETKNEITISRIADMANGSSIASKLDEMQKRIESSCPNIYQDYCQEEPAYMLTHLGNNY